MVWCCGVDGCCGVLCGGMFFVKFYVVCECGSWCCCHRVWGGVLFYPLRCCGVACYGAVLMGVAGC